MENNNNDNISFPVGSSTEEILAQVKASREKAKEEAEKRYESEIAAKLEAQRLEREKQIKEEEEARQKAEAEFRLRIEREERARVEAEVKAKIDREIREKEEAEEKRFREMQAQLRIEAERRAREEAEQRMREEIATRERIEREVREKAETEYRAKVEAEYRAKIEEATRERERAVAIARAEAERRIIEAAEAKARAEIIEKSRREAEMRAKAEQEMRARVAAEIREKAEAEERQRLARAEQSEKELRELAEEQRKIAQDESAKIKLELAYKAAIEQSYNNSVDDTYDEPAVQNPTPATAPIFEETVVAPTAPVETENQDVAPIEQDIAEKSFLDDIRSNSDLDSILRRKKYRIFLDEDKVASRLAEKVEDEYGFQQMQEAIASDFNVNEDWSDDVDDTYDAEEDNTEGFTLPEDQPKEAIFNDVAGITSGYEATADVEKAVEENAEEVVLPEPDFTESEPDEVVEPTEEIITAAETLAELEENIKAESQISDDDPLAAFFAENNDESDAFGEDSVFAAEAGMSSLERLNLSASFFADDDTPEKPTAESAPVEMPKQKGAAKKSLRGLSLGGKPKGSSKNSLFAETSEYVHPADKEDMLKKLSSIKLGAIIKSVVTTVVFILSIVLQLSPALSMTLPEIMNYRSNPSGYLICNIVVLVAGIAMNFKELLFAVKQIIKGKFPFEASATVASLTGLIYSFMLFSKTEDISMGASTLTFFPLMLLTIMSFGRLLTLMRTHDNFGFMTIGNGDHAVCRVENEAIKREIRSLTREDAVIVGERKSAFTEDFFQNSFKDTESEKLHTKMSFIALGAFLLIFVVSLICGAGFVGSFGNSLAVYALSSPSLFGFAVALQLFISNKQHLSSGAALVGADAVKEFNSVRYMVVPSNDLFLSVDTAGLRFLTDNVDEIIKYTAAATLLARSPIADTFMGMIEDDTKQLPKVDSLLYKDKMGLICTAEKKKILIGSRDFLSDNNIAVPSKEAEEKVLNGRILVSMVYIAIDGELSAMFAVSYKADENMVEKMVEANSCGVKFAIITSDPNITPEFLETGLNLKPSSVVVLPSKMIAEYAEEQEEDNTVAGIIHNGTIEGFATGIAGAKLLANNLKLIRLLQLLLSVLGLVIPSLFLIFSGFTFIRAIFIAIILIAANIIIPTVKRA